MNYHTQLLRDVIANLSTSPQLGSAEPQAQTIVHEESVPAVVNRKNVFRHPVTHPLVLDLLLIQKYGEQWLGWEIETLERVVPTDFGVDRISDLNVSKIQAMRTLHLVDSPWQQWESFVWCAMPLNGIFPDFQVMQVPSVAEAMVAVDVMNHVRDDMQWSEELMVYLAMVHVHEGVLVAQAPLSFVPLYDDYEHASEHQLLHGVDTRPYGVDTKWVRGQWPNVRMEGVAPQGDTQEVEQLRRMLQAHQYVELRRAQLKKQLETVYVA